MIFKQKGHQVSYGEAIGILLIENHVPFVPGDVANATSYDFPVRFERLNGFTPARLFAHDTSMVDEGIAAGKRLVAEGVRAVTGDCGFLAIYQEKIAAEIGVPTFMTSLLQLPFVEKFVGSRGKVGIITANKGALTRMVLDAAGAGPDERHVIAGLEDKPHFPAAVFDEIGEFDTDRVEDEVLQCAAEVTADPAVKAILLECSLLPPYAAAVHETTGLPVFDYNTMIRHVHQALVPRTWVNAHRFM